MKWAGQTQQDVAQMNMVLTPRGEKVVGWLFGILFTAALVYAGTADAALASL